MRSEPLKIAVFGAGLVGSYLGGQLVYGGQSVSFIGREKSKASFESRGLKLTHYARDDILISQSEARFSTSLESLETADIILLTVKSQDTKAAAVIIKASANPEALIISFQNGVRNGEVLEAALEPLKTLRAVIPFNVTATGNALHCGTEGELTIEQNNDPRLASLIQAFAQAGQGASLSLDIENIQWGKLLVNLNNALNTLMGESLRAGLTDRDYRRAFVVLLKEALQIARAGGIEPAAFGKASPEKMIKILSLPNFLYRPIMNKIIKIDFTARSSMLDDLEAGKPCEIEYLQGEVVRLAEDLGLSAPFNAKILDLTQQAFKNGRSPKMRGDQIYAAMVS